MVRSREHLDWRYDRRGGDFHLRLAEDAATAPILGYAVGNAARRSEAIWWTCWRCPGDST